MVSSSKALRRAEQPALEQKNTQAARRIGLAGIAGQDGAIQFLSLLQPPRLMGGKRLLNDRVAGRHGSCSARVGLLDIRDKRRHSQIG